MSETGKELMSLLTDIYDDHDFVCGTMSIAGDEASLEKLRDYILYAKDNGQEISSDDIVALSLSLREEQEVKGNMRSSGKNGVRVAML